MESIEMKQFKAMNVQRRGVLIESGTSNLEGDLSIGEYAPGSAEIASARYRSRH